MSNELIVKFTELSVIEWKTSLFKDVHTKGTTLRMGFNSLCKYVVFV